MTPFLQEIAVKLIQEEELSSMVIILPSKRAGKFLLDHLVNKTTLPFFSPKIISIEAFIEDVSGHQIISNTELLLEAYEVYSKKGKESFEEFLNWAEVVLNDFNEIDRYLVSTHNFFDYLASIKKMEYWGDTQKDSKWVKQFFSFWDSLSDFYQELNDHLSVRHKGYQGAVYRKAAEDIEHYLEKHLKTKHWFVGFNALNQCEQQIIQGLLENSPSKIFWDQDQYFLSEEKEHVAGMFLKSYFKQWKYFKEKEKNDLPSHYTEPKDIEILEAPHDIAQVKFIGSLLKNAITPKTALVLADEKLLLPLLHSLPEDIGPVNITMGIPIRSHPIINLLQRLLEVHKNSSTSYYYKQVETILSFGIIKKVIPTTAKHIIQEIRKSNKGYITFQELIELSETNDTVLISLLFQNEDGNFEKILKRIEDLLHFLQTNTSLHFIEHAVIQKLCKGIDQIKETFKSLTFPVKSTFLKSLFERIIATESLDLEGNPQEGLQIMGILETRVLDFDHVIVLSVNEGILPQGKSQNSFITYDLKKQFQLPSYTEKDAIYAYHFFRLLQRAKKVTLLYKASSQGIQSGERSRFIRQIETEDIATHTLVKKEISQPISLAETPKRIVVKTKTIKSRLEEIAKKGLSPSALTTYIRNPYQFYAQRVLRIHEFDEVEETVAYNTLGTIVHETLEQLYAPFKNALLTAELLAKTKKKVNTEIIVQFKKHFKEGDFTKGKNLIIFEVAKKYVEKLIDWDLKQLGDGNSIEILELEKVLNIPIKVKGLSFPVRITGTVDRIDRYNDTIRVIDYKSGMVKQGELDLTDWDDLIQDYKYSKAFQVLMYSYLIANEPENQYIPKEAGIVSFKNMRSGLLKFGKKEAANSRSKDQSISEDVLSSFEIQLKQIIQEICDPETPFEEKEV